jgi:uracil-DNA glycosylase
MQTIERLRRDINNCVLCQSTLPLEPRPIVQFSAESKLLIVGQAPGIKAHKLNRPFEDASGNRLRNWLGLNRAQFYDASLTAIVPMGFCYPGRGTSGDLPPLQECAKQWRTSLLKELKFVQLTIVVGLYAMRYHFPQNRSNLTEIVKDWSSLLPSYVALPHPSPRNNIWLKKNPWFEKDCVPELQKRIKDVVS